MMSKSLKEVQLDFTNQLNQVGKEKSVIEFEIEKCNKKIARLRHRHAELREEYQKIVRVLETLRDIMERRV